MPESPIPPYPYLILDAMGSRNRWLHAIVWHPDEPHEIHPNTESAFRALAAAGVAACRVFAGRERALLVLAEPADAVYASEESEAAAS